MIVLLFWDYRSEEFLVTNVLKNLCSINVHYWMFNKCSIDIYWWCMERSFVVRLTWGNIYQLEKMHWKNCELSFIWGKMRTIAWETASQIALRYWLWRYSGKRSVLCMVLLTRVNAVKCTFWHKVASSHEEQMCLLTILVLC